MPDFHGLSKRNLQYGVLLAIFPWLPAYLFERIDFYLGVSVSGYWYYQLTGWRLPADVVSFGLGGILVAYLLRPRWALIQIFLNALLVWTLLYVACSTFRGDNGLLHSECYSTGPDGLAGFRFAALMFSFGSLPALVKVAPKGPTLRPAIRFSTALLSGAVLTVVMAWFPLTAWFSGVTYLPPLDPFQAGVLVGLPQIATGILAARISRSLKIAALSGTFTLFLMSAGLWSLSCPNCDRSLLYLLSISWAFFALLGGMTEIGIDRFRFPTQKVPLTRVKLEDIRRLGIAAVLTFCLWTVAARDFWEPRVLYASSISPALGNLALGQSSYPYVAGYYNSVQYRICCLQLGVSFLQVNRQLLAPSNFLMAGMGVQSPNCCIDGWDLGWRADVFVLPNSSLIVSGSTWSTCDSNANCGGHFWQYLRYHAQVTLNPQDISTPIYLRMSWEPIRQNGQALYEANWYYNTTNVPWTLFGSFVPDFREGHYFDIGLPGGGVDFYQFGVASKTPVSGWKVRLLYPSFLDNSGAWRRMERANIVQGDHSLWKVMYRWGGSPYPGAGARANLQDPSVPPGEVEFAYTGETLGNGTPLW